MLMRVLFAVTFSFSFENGCNRYLDFKKRRCMYFCQEVLELTDGWYMIKTILDTPLSVLVQKGQIAIGQKLFISGAELSGSTEAASPLEAVALQFYQSVDLCDYTVCTLIVTYHIVNISLCCSGQALQV